MTKVISFGFVFSLFLIFGLLQCSVNQNTNIEEPFAWDMAAENHSGQSKKLYYKDGKHRGMSAFHWRGDMDEALNQLMKNNIECVALVPFLDQQTEYDLVSNNHEKMGIWTRRDSTFIRVIHKIHARNMHVMLKPHLWLQEGWRSNIQMKSKTDWDAWFDSYKLHIIHYAMLAEEFNIELFCIGAELKPSLKAQPEKWLELVQEVKNIYSGKLTYAANWDGEFNDIDFWDQMDYIGIQAYFPLTNKSNPSLTEVKQGWMKHIELLEKLSKKYNKPILFTETGYRSDEIATIEPWLWGRNLETATNKKSEETQNTAYEALFQQLWNKEWFAGTYFWQWHNESNKDRMRDNMDFTPRFKQAENTIAKWYGKR